MLKFYTGKMHIFFLQLYGAHGMHTHHALANVPSPLVTRLEPEPACLILHHLELRDVLEM